jgi:hypothetical protein
MGSPPNALDFLLAGGIDVDAVRERLPHVDAAGVRVRVASRWFTTVWGNGIDALTMPWAVYVKPPVMERFRAGGDMRGIAVLMIHELVHVEQLRRLGVLRQVTWYVADYIRGRIRRLGHWEAYRAVRFEVEARLIASEFTGASPP